MNLIKQRLLVCVLILIFVPGYTQKILLNMGMDIGSSLSRGTSNQRARIGIFASGYYKVGHSQWLGLEASSSGGLIQLLGGDINGPYYDATQNKTILSPYNVKASAYLVRLRHTLLSGDVSPYVDLGLGVNKFYYNYPVPAVKQVAKHNFSFTPKVGITIHPVEFSVYYLYAGRTPSFEGTTASGSVVELASKNLSFFCLRLAVQFRLAKSKH